MTFSLLFKISSAQTFELNFLGEDFMQYKGVYLKLSDNASSFNNAFYSSLNSFMSDENNVMYPDSKYRFNTIKDSITNRIFKVVDIVDKNGNTHRGISPKYDKAFLVLSDTVTKQIIYFKYDAEYSRKFPFNTSKINLDGKILCGNIERKIDDFENTIKLNSPLFINNQIAPLIIYKDISKTNSSYFLSIRTIGSTATVDGTGVTIIFDDGTKWSKPVKIDVKVNNSGFEYSAFIPLTTTDLNTFSQKKVTKFRLYVYDKNISSIDGEKFSSYVKCIKDLK